MHVISLHKSECEDRSASLIYDSRDAPTAESDSEIILGKTCT